MLVTGGLSGEKIYSRSLFLVTIATSSFFSFVLGDLGAAFFLDRGHRGTYSWRWITGMIVKKVNQNSRRRLRKSKVLKVKEKFHPATVIGNDSTC